MTKVYIITQYDRYNASVVSVHRTRKKANKKVDKLELKNDDMFTGYYVTKRKVRG